MRGGELRSGFFATPNVSVALRAVLAGERSGRRDAVLLNAGAALVAAELADDLGEGFGIAAEAIDSGAAAARLDDLREFSHG